MLPRVAICLQVLSQALSHSSSNMKRCQLLKLYQDQLRAEETKLILLKKLKLSLVSICSISSIHIVIPVVGIILNERQLQILMDFKFSGMCVLLVDS